MPHPSSPERSREPSPQVYPVRKYSLYKYFINLLFVKYLYKYSENFQLKILYPIFHSVKRIIKYLHREKFRLIDPFSRVTAAHEIIHPLFSNFDTSKQLITMSQNIYSVDGVVDTIKDGNVIHVKWKVLYNAEAIYESCNAQMKAVQNEGVELIIIDMMDAKGTPPTECQSWFGEVLFPGFNQNPDFKGLVNVLPESAITKMGAKRWKQTATTRQVGIDVYETDSMDGAKKLATELGLN